MFQVFARRTRRLRSIRCASSPTARRASSPRAPRSRAFSRSSDCGPKWLAESTERGYVELNRRALALAADGGRVVTASCSYNVRPELFVKFLASASRLSRRPAFLDALHGAAPDHPALLTLPESAYLKCAFLRVG